MKGRRWPMLASVFGGIAPLPFRSAKAEAALKGKEVSSAISEACAVAVEGAKALSKNAYKIQVAKGDPGASAERAGLKVTSPSRSDGRGFAVARI